MNFEELNFAYKVRHALNEEVDRLPEGVADRLAQARHAAIERKRPDSPRKVLAQQEAFAGHAGGFFQGRMDWLRRMGVSLPALALVFGLMGLYQYEEQRQIRETADIDVAVLADELPPSAYADAGFKAYLEKRGG